MILQLVGRKVEVQITRRAAISRLTITVYPDFRITAVAPTGFSDEEIERRIRRRALWIEKQIRFFESFVPRETERRYISGESHRYLGRQYRLKVEQGDEPTAKLKGRHLHVWVPDVKDRQHVAAIVRAWYVQRCHDVFSVRLEKCYKKSRDVLKLPMPSMIIRRMAKRWGSYTTSGRLILNIDLVKVPGDCIEYVIMHELCHGRHPNHSKRFERLLSRLMPDWRERRDRLDREL